MFVFSCPRHGTDVMIWSSDIEAIHNTPDGIDVHFRCSCGVRGILKTGAGRAERVVLAASV
jgi:hypothetical protein